MVFSKYFSIFPRFEKNVGHVDLFTQKAKKLYVFKYLMKNVQIVLNVEKVENVQGVHVKRTLRTICTICTFCTFNTYKTY